MTRTIATALLLLAHAPIVGAQEPLPAPPLTAPVPDTVTSNDGEVAEVPFGPGEKMTYRVTYGWLGKRGTASTEVGSVEDIRGNPSYHLSFRVRGGALGWNMNDLQESWLDVDQLYAHRFKQDLNQSTYTRLRTLDFYPEEGVWRQVEKIRSGKLASDMPLDDVSFLFWIRTLPLEVGETHEFERYFKSDGNPVIIQVLRRETIEVPAGTFETIVVRPIIQTDGMFSEGGEAEVYFTDDDRRVIVLVKTKMAIGTMQLQLEEYTPGEKWASARP